MDLRRLGIHAVVVGFLLGKIDRPLKPEKMIYGHSALVVPKAITNVPCFGVGGKNVYVVE